MSLNDATTLHELLEGVRRGLWSPAAAQARADELNRGPLNPLDSSTFDVLRLHRWTVPMAICWIARRDKERVYEYWPLWQRFRWQWQAVSWRFHSKSGESVDGNGYALVEADEDTSYFHWLDHADDGSQPASPHITYTAARSELWERLKDGQLIAEGRLPQPSTQSSLPKTLWTEIDPRRWQTMRIDEKAKDYDRLCCTVGDKTDRYLGDVLIRTFDLFRIWPEDLSDRLREGTTDRTTSPPNPDRKREIIRDVAANDPNWKAISNGEREAAVQAAFILAGYKTGWRIGMIRPAVRGTDHQWWTDSET